MELVKQDVGVWVNCKDELPKKDMWVICPFGVRWFFKGKFYKDAVSYEPQHETRWQKPIEQVYVLTEEQLNEIENKAYKEGRESVSVTDFNRE